MTTNNPIIVPPNSSISAAPDPNAADPWDDLCQQEAKQVLGHREQFAAFAIGVAQAWVGFLFVLSAAQFSLKSLGFGLSEGEFLMVFGSSTASILGYAYLVGKYLFPDGGSKGVIDRN